MNLEIEVKELLKEGYTVADILKACKKIKESSGQEFAN